MWTPPFPYLLSRGPLPFWPCTSYYIYDSLIPCFPTFTFSARAPHFLQFYGFPFPHPNYTLHASPKSKPKHWRQQFFIFFNHVLYKKEILIKIKFMIIKYEYSPIRSHFFYMWLIWYLVNNLWVSFPLIWPILII